MYILELSAVQASLVVILGLITLATLAGGLYAVFRSSAQDARIKRLQDERDDYLSRLNYVEPKLLEAEQQNRVLLELHNPSDQLEAIKAQGQVNHDRIVEIIRSQTTTLRQAIQASHQQSPGEIS